MTTRVSPSTAHLVQLAVAPDARGSGIGRALVDRVCDVAAAAGYTALTLMVGRRNHRARKLYESAGFAPIASFTCAAPVSRAGSRAWPRAAA